MLSASPPGSMIFLLPGIAAVLLYLGATFLPPSWGLRKRLLVLGGAAALLHGIHLAGTLASSLGLRLDAIPMINLIFWLVVLLTLGNLLRRKPVENISVVLFLLAALTAGLGLYWWLTFQGAPQYLGWPKALHLMSSVLAYIAFSLAALQAIALTLLEHQLRRHRTRGIVQLLPPLQTMEELLFEMIGGGVLLLTLAVLSGLAFFPHPFQGALLLKTLLSILVWVLFIVLLWGRYRLGWRSSTAVRWTLSGFLSLLLLYYFGPQLISP